MVVAIVVGSAVALATACWAAADGLAATWLLTRLRSDHEPAFAPHPPVPAAVGRWMFELGIDRPVGGPEHAATKAREGVALWRAWLATAGLSAALIPAVPAAVLVLVVVLLAPAAARRVARRRTSTARRQQLGPALEGVAGALRAGRSLRQALELVDVGEPLTSELRSLGRAASRGRPLSSAVEDWSRTSTHPDVRLAGAALTMADAVGGPAARALDATASNLRERLELAAEASALASQAQLSAAVLTVAPLVFLVSTSMSDERTASFLFGSVLGWACLTVGVALDAVGCWWMLRLTATVTR